MADKSFDEILDECIDRLAKGETLQQCLNDYPEHAEELSSLLGIATTVSETTALEPRPEFKRQARQQLNAAIATQKIKREPHKLPLFGWQLRHAMATAAAVFLFLVIVSSSTVYASRDAMPDDTLYPIKLATEEVRLALTFSDTEKAKLHADLAKERAEEITEMAEAGKTKEVEKTTSRLTDSLNSIEEVATENQDAPKKGEQLEKLKEWLQDRNTSTQETFQEAEPKIPEETQEAFREAITKYDEVYQKALDTIEALQEEVDSSRDDTDEDLEEGAGEESGQETEDKSLEQNTGGENTGDSNSLSNQSSASSHK